MQLRDILKGSDIVREAPKPPVKSPELLARLEKLQRLEDDRQYKAMVHDITDHVGYQTYWLSPINRCSTFLRQTDQCS